MMRTPARIMEIGIGDWHRAGNARVCRGMIQLAWRGLRYVTIGEVPAGAVLRSAT
jgi:hypothetical protein